MKSIVMLEAAKSSRNVVPYHITTQHHNSQDHNVEAQIILNRCKANELITITLDFSLSNLSGIIYIH